MRRQEETLVTGWNSSSGTGRVALMPRSSRCLPPTQRRRFIRMQQTYELTKEEDRGANLATSQSNTVPWPAAPASIAPSAPQRVYWLHDQPAHVARPPAGVWRQLGPGVLSRTNRCCRTGGGTCHSDVAHETPISSQPLSYSDTIRNPDVAPLQVETEHQNKYRILGGAPVGRAAHLVRRRRARPSVSDPPDGSPPPQSRRPSRTLPRRFHQSCGGGAQFS